LSQKITFVFLTLPTVYLFLKKWKFRFVIPRIKLELKIILIIRVRVHTLIVTHLSHLWDGSPSPPGFIRGTLASWEIKK